MVQSRNLEGMLSAHDWHTVVNHEPTTVFKAFSARGRWAISDVRQGSSRQLLERFEIFGPGRSRSCWK